MKEPTETDAQARVYQGPQTQEERDARDFNKLVMLAQHVLNENDDDNLAQLVRKIVASSDCRYCGFYSSDEDFGPDDPCFQNSTFRICVAMFDDSDVESALQFALSFDAPFLYVFGTNETPDPVDQAELSFNTDGAPEGYDPRFMFFRDVHFLAKHETILKKDLK